MEPGPNSKMFMADMAERFRAGHEPTSAELSTTSHSRIPAQEKPLNVSGHGSAGLMNTCKEAPYQRLPRLSIISRRLSLWIFQKPALRRNNRLTFLPLR